MIIFLMCLGTASIIYNYKTIDKYKYEMYKSQLDLSACCGFFIEMTILNRQKQQFQTVIKQHFQPAIKRQFQTVID